MSAVRISGHTRQEGKHRGRCFFIPILKKVYSVKKRIDFFAVFFSGLGMIQVSTSEKDLGFETIGSKNSPIQNISKIEQNARPVGGGRLKEAEHHCMYV